MITIQDIMTLVTTGSEEGDQKLESMIEAYADQKINQRFSEPNTVNIVLFKNQVDRIKGSLLFSTDHLMTMGEQAKVLGIQGLSKNLVHVAVENHEIFSIIESQMASK